jgi:metallophosphoesterase (TIGR00282 family)
MKILFCGDIVGRSGRQSALINIPKLKQEHNLDFIIANVDNASGGFGVNENNSKDFIEIGVDVLTGGDHIWDKKEMLNYITREKRILRPLNFPKSSPGTGARIFTSINNKKVLVIHLLGQVFIKNNLNCPFESIDNILKNYKLGVDVDAIFVDFHAEASSEKMAMGKFLDGKISAVIGSHTHIPTNDHHIMSEGTAYQTDAGMCGDYDSIIGMQTDVPLKSFLSKRRVGKMVPAKKEATFCGSIIEIHDSGLAKNINIVKIGGVLDKNSPT